MFHNNPKYTESSTKVLEMGTGTGLVGIYLGLRFQALNKQAELILTDLEKPSLEFA